MANFERDFERTGGASDFELAIRFYDDFSKGDSDFIGKVIPNEIFNEWINEDLDFSYINHGWSTPEGKVAWAGYRSTVRGYLKHGVMDPEYGLAVKSGVYEPYIVKVNTFGSDLVVVQYSDHIVDTAMGLAIKRQKTIKSQTKDIKKGFNAMKEVYGVKDLNVDLQEKLLESQNEMRLHIEKAFDEIYKKTIKDTADLISASRSAIKKITESTEEFNL